MVMVISDPGGAMCSDGEEGYLVRWHSLPLQQQAAREGRTGARPAPLHPESRMPTLGRQEFWGHARGNSAAQAET